MKICEYRNCDNEVIGRSDKRFCDKKCKHNEREYLRRHRKMIKGVLKLEQDKVDLIKLVRSL
jgi:hypothetical protein